jgi:hypothetical protein
VTRTRNAKALGVFAVLAVALGIVLGITVLGSGVAATSKPASVEERVASAGVYEMTVVIKTDSRSANLRVTIGSIERHVLLSDHRAVVRQKVTVTGRDVPIKASASNASPTITVSSRRLASLPTSAPAPAGALVGVETGVNVTSNVGFTSPQVLADISASRPAWVRVFMQWSDLEPQQGSYAPGWISIYQKFFDALPSGTQVDVDVVGAPAWANGGSDSIATPPSNPADFANFLSHIVSTFHGRVTAWEIWNEEASANWWTGTPAQFTALLKAAYPAIKSADPKAIVIMGASDPTFLAAVYAAGGKGSFDAVAVHTDTSCNIASPYTYEYNQDTTTVNQYFFLGFTDIHTLMAANGDATMPIYMTEIGWSSTAAECETGAWAGQKLGGITEAQQATYLQEAYHCLAQPQYSYVKAAMWFAMYNGAAGNAPINNYGLLDSNFDSKPAFAAFEDESLHGDQLTGPCGNFNGPAITIAHPTPGERYSGTLRVTVTASSPANGVRWIRIRLSKSTLVQFVSKTFAKDLSGTIAWQGGAKLPLGPHTITVTTDDKLGNISTASIHVVHTQAASVRRAKR